MCFFFLIDFVFSVGPLCRQVFCCGCLGLFPSDCSAPAALGVQALQGRVADLRSECRTEALGEEVEGAECFFSCFLVLFINGEWDLVLLN